MLIARPITLKHHTNTNSHKQHPLQLRMPGSIFSQPGAVARVTALAVTPSTAAEKLLTCFSLHPDMIAVLSVVLMYR